MEGKETEVSKEATERDNEADSKDVKSGKYPRYIGGCRTPSTCGWISGEVRKTVK